MDVGNLVAKLTLDSAGFSKGISEANSLASGLAGGIGKVLGGVTTAVTASVAAAGAAVGSVVKSAVEGFAQFEQLAGGAQKIFDDMDYNKIQADANAAWQTMNLSASQYLSTINTVGASFAATMGDQAGYDTAKQGMQAIADYASGTGRNVEELNQKFAMITRSTSSYQSIADQFSGILPATSQAFLEQAQSAGLLSTSYEKLTEVPIAEYQQAVTEMLEQGVTALGLAGNTAAETANTVSGSFNAMKASWDNLLVSLAGGGASISESLNALVTSAGYFIQNLIPVIEQALYGIGELITRIAPIIAAKLPELLGTLVPMLTQAAVSIVNALIQNLPSLIQTIATAITAMIPQLVEAIIATLGVLLTSVLPALAEVAVQLVLTLGQSLVNNADLLIGATLDLVFGIIDTIIQHLPEFLEIGIKIVLKIAEGILMAIPRLFVSVGKLLGIVDDTEDHFQKKTDNIVEIVNTGTQDVSTALNGFSYNVKDYTGRVSDDVDEMGEHYEKTFDEMTKAATGFQRSAEDTGKWVKEAEVKITDANGKVIDSFRTTTMEVKNVYDGISSESIMAEKYISDAMDYVASKSEKAASSVESAVTRMNNAIGSVSGGDLIIGHRASGGPVVAGSAYMTGELGRELFVPATDGYIFNNDDTEDILGSRGGDIVIQIQGDVYDDERSMKRKVSKAVRSVIESELAYGI
jgi:hypothetical protein